MSPLPEEDRIFLSMLVASSYENFKEKMIMTLEVFCAQNHIDGAGKTELVNIIVTVFSDAFMDGMDAGLIAYTRKGQ
jgi:hypothetical protein